jgi:preprotein translocase subunit SecF
MADKDDNDQAPTGADPHRFRYLLKPGNDFRIVRQMRWAVPLSIVMCIAAIALLFVNKQVRGDYMNWTIDFKGGTEVVYSFTDKADPTHPVRGDTGKIRDALKDAGVEGFDVSEMSWTHDVTKQEIYGVTVRTPSFGALSRDEADQATLAVEEHFADRGLQKVNWSGDRLFVRSTQLIPEDEMKTVLASILVGGQGIELKPVEAGQAQLNTTPNEDTGEYNSTFTIYGLDRQYEQVIETALGNVDANIEQSHGVGAKAGDKLRNDGIKALLFAMALIMLYLAVRFDIRYAPGAVVALIHDALIVIGVFAVTWTEVSLTSVAALLTVIGFSVNDTVIIFDRIRENMVKLKDKKIERIVEISLNETLVRSILTSVTLFATTLMMNLFGTGLVKDFAFAMNVGIIVGTYSSIFLAAPLFIFIHRRWYSGPVKQRGRRPASTAA